MTTSSGDDAAESAVDDGAAESAVESAAESAAGEGRSYKGIFGAFPYAFRASDSWLFRSYALVGGLAAGGVVVLFALALVVAIDATTGGGDGTFTFSRAFFVFLMLLVVAPLVAPILAVARRHRRGSAATRDESTGHDRALAASGYLFLLSLYLGLAISVPPALQEDSPGAVGAFLYSLPRLAGVGPPLAGAALVYLVYRYYR